MNGMRWVSEEEEGCRGEELFIGSMLRKKLLMALLHDWAFVTAIVLPATSARGIAFSASQLIINHLGLITKEAASSPTDVHLFSFRPVVKNIFRPKLSSRQCSRELQQNVLKDITCWLMTFYVELSFYWK